MTIEITIKTDNDSITVPVGYVDFVLTGLRKTLNYHTDNDLKELDIQIASLEYNITNTRESRDLYKIRLRESEANLAERISADGLSEYILEMYKVTPEAILALVREFMTYRPYVTTKEIATILGLEGIPISKSGVLIRNIMSVFFPRWTYTKACIPKGKGYKRP